MQERLIINGYTMTNDTRVMCRKHMCQFLSNSSSLVTYARV